MNGLLQIAPSAAPAQAQPVPAEQSARSSADTNEQSKYDLVAGLMVKHVFDNADAIVDTLQRGQNPVQAIAVIISNLMMFSISMAEKNQQAIPPKMLFQAAVESAGAIGELMLDRQLVDEQLEAQLTEAGFYAALDMFGQRATLTDEERQQYVAVMDEFQQLGQQAQPVEQGAGHEFAR